MASIPDPIRVAVVGAGPAGFYFAEGLLGEGARFTVDMFDRLPTPWGLVRAGVAPDHPKIKGVSKRYEQTAGKPGFRFHGNVEIGRDISHAELVRHFHAVVYTTGAALGRRLGIPGEELPGSVSATNFVAWYNGHPDATELSFDLGHPRAVVVGNGNVALDVARMLMVRPELLEKTDVADHALAVLRSHMVREVVILGRRGPHDASFTTPELLELETLTDAKVIIEGASDFAVPDGADGRVRRNLEVIARYAENERPADGRTIVLRFLASPVELNGDGRVEAVRVVRNELLERDGRRVASPTDDVTELEAGLVVSSVGYRGQTIPGVPFDERAGTIPNQHGRVIDPASGKPVPGLYTAGWVKRGPSGIIGTNKKDANDTLASLRADLDGAGLPEPETGPDHLDQLLAHHPVVDLDAWLRIDAHERALGAEQSRPRVKLTQLDELLTRARGE